MTTKRQSDDESHLPEAIPLLEQLQECERERRKIQERANLYAWAFYTVLLALVLRGIGTYLSTH